MAEDIGVREKELLLYDSRTEWYAMRKSTGLKRMEWGAGI